MRQCTSCNQVKPLAEFAKAGLVKKVQYYRHKCIQCYSAQKSNERRLHSEKFTELKKTLKCERCGCSDFRTLEFHHRDPSDKLREISEMVLHKVSWSTILREMEKCECLCANCHRIHHYEERQSGCSSAR